MHTSPHSWELNSAQAGDVCKALTLRTRNRLLGLDASQLGILRQFLVLPALASPTDTNLTSDVQEHFVSLWLIWVLGFIITQLGFAGLCGIRHILWLSGHSLAGHKGRTAATRWLA